jgi:hypothetical protein
MKLIRKLQRQEDQANAERLAKITRGLRDYGRRFSGFELTNIENAIYPAIGRAALED